MSSALTVPGAGHQRAVSMPVTSAETKRPITMSLPATAAGGAGAVAADEGASFDLDESDSQFDMSAFKDVEYNLAQLATRYPQPPEYKVIEEIGKGAFGIVHKALPSDSKCCFAPYFPPVLVRLLTVLLDRECVAIKILDLNRFGDDDEVGLVLSFARSITVCSFLPLQLDVEDSYRKFEETWMEITHTRFLRHPNILRCGPLLLLLCLALVLMHPSLSSGLADISPRSSRPKSSGLSCR
jgi:serine/threonine protein kinase